MRTSLALSAILRKPFTIHHIRSKRKNPGLQAQHLEGVEALSRITEAETEGVKFGSQKITFHPKKILPGDYQFEVKTAGSVTLLLQAIFLPLLDRNPISQCRPQQKLPSISEWETELQRDNEKVDSTGHGCLRPNSMLNFLGPNRGEGKLPEGEG